MLLLSSATRILATERPPTMLYPRAPHSARYRMTYSRVLEHPLKYASISTGQACVGSEYYRSGPCHGPRGAIKRAGCGRVSLHPRSFSWSSPYGQISPGDDFSQSLLFLAARFFVAAPLGSILGSVVLRRAVRLEGLGSLSRSRRRGVGLGSRFGSSCCSGTTLGSPCRRRRVRIWLRRGSCLASRCRRSHTLRSVSCLAAASWPHSRYDSCAGATAADSRLTPARQNINSRFALRLRRHRRLSVCGRRPQLLRRAGMNHSQRLLDEQFTLPGGILFCRHPGDGLGIGYNTDAPRAFSRLFASGTKA